ncbi:MAG: VanW family protein [Thermoleophilia bacterium]|nr:VanW family protein [Thermoleophilia bacterium]
MRRRAFVLVAVLALLALGSAPMADLLLSRGVIHRGVGALGVDLGGLDRTAATDVLRSRITDLIMAPLSVTSGASKILLEAVPAETGVIADVEATVAAAWAQGRSGSWPDRVRQRLSLWRARRQVEAVFYLDEAVWSSFADEVALRYERLARDARLTLTVDGPKAVAAETGLVLDRETFAAAVLRAVQAGESRVEVPLREIPPAVTTEDALRALRLARVAFGAPVTLGYQEHRFTLIPEQLSAVAAVNPNGLASGLPLTFDTPEARELLEKVLAPVQEPAVDAVIVPAVGDKSFTVEPSRDGTQLEWDAVLTGLARAAVDPSRRYVALATTRAAPKLSTEDAEQLGVRHEIASFTTYFSPANQARVHNIQQVAAILDGTIVRPGQTFSFNQTVGPRTKAAGFDEAPVIRDGALTPGVGGGICQVSTTLFNAVFFAGLPVVERKPHSFYIDHYPVGRDATVSYGTTDLKFRNDSGEMLLVTVRADERSVTVSLAAAEWDRVVTYQTTSFHDFVGPPSTAERPRRLRDPAMASGTTSPLEAGVSGRAVEVTRTVSQAGGAVLFRDSFESRYEPKDYIVRVGG